jgi:DNA-binding IclR family transcriptional regulator
MAGPDRTLSVLKLFTLERPAWTVEEAATSLAVSVSSAYRYFAALTEAGLLTTTASGFYVLGPAIIQFDRQLQLTDPMLQLGKAVMADIMGYAPTGSTVLLCRIFRDTVLCVHQVVSGETAMRVSYERGRPMPLFRGATSKIILAHLPPRELRRLYGLHHVAIAAAKLGETWESFRTQMARMRKAGTATSFAELDPDVIGIAAPIIDDRKRVVGSLSYVIPIAEERIAPRLAAVVATGAREIGEGAPSQVTDKRPSKAAA